VRKAFIGIVLSCLFAVPAWAAGGGPSAADVGDVASFGRAAKWMGVGQTTNVFLRSDCTISPPAAGERCITLNPAPASTSFDERDLGVIRLPARATNSIVCHFFSPFWFFQLNNTTGVAQPDGRARFSAYMTVENAVLNDPSLIDPSTGLPYGGRFEQGIPGSLLVSRSMAAGEREQRNEQYSRVCIAGIISRGGLIGMGLSDAQATDFFKNPITLRLNLRGNVRLVEDAALFYGLRLLGD